MVRAFCKSGEQEVLKGAVHGAACVIAGVMATYNLAAWCYRRERHLGTNALVYMLAVAFEAKQTLHHLNHVQPEPECEVDRSPAAAA